MNKNTRALSQLLIAFCLGTLSHISTAADVTVIPPSGSGLAVRDSGDTIDRFRVNEAGTVLIPGLGSATAQGTVTCFNSATGQLGPCSGSLTGPAGPAGPVGPAGPTGATGPSGPAGPAGAMGPTGATGAAGPAGAAGAGVLSGTGSPVAGVGNNGDFYIDTTTSVLFGPKTSGAWPSSGVSLIGPAGVAGPTGPTGAVGATGPVGPAGPTGAAGSTGPTGATGPAGPAGFAGSTSITPSPGAASTDVEQTASASCSTAGRLTGGGCFPNITASDYLNSMYYMYGFPADSTTWVCVYRNFSGNSVTARAICAP